MPNKMERFTQRARRVLSLAQEEAERLQHNYIGTEHLLLGLMREQGSVAYRVLHDLGLEQRRVEELVEQMTRATPRIGMVGLDLSPDTKRVLELAVDEARRMEHRYIDTGHLLLGLARQSEGVAIDVLKRLGVSPDEVRRQVRRVLQKEPQQGAQVAAKQARETIEPHVLASLILRVQTSLLPKLLSRFVQSSTETVASEIPAILKALVDEILSEQAIILNEDYRARLLTSLEESLVSVEDQRRLHVQIADKTTGQVIVDMRVKPSEAQGILRNYAEYVETRQRGQEIVLEDDQARIVISIDDEPEGAHNSNPWKSKD